LFFYLLGAIFEPFDDFVGLKPAWITSKMWTTITCGFFHKSGNFLELIINIITLIVIIPIIDPIWRSMEVLKFIIGVNFICSVCTTLLRVFIYYVTSDPKLLFITIGGFFGSSTALVVALKQVNPEKEWRWRTLYIRAKHLPSTFLLIALILFFFPGTESSTIEFWIFGLLVSWIYLRYFQYHDSVYGDHTTQFKFSTLFPEILYPFFDGISRFCCCMSGKKKPSSIFIEPEVNQSKDADRQRKLALKVLDDKFQNMKEIPLPVQPDKKELQEEKPELNQT